MAWVWLLGLATLAADVDDQAQRARPGQGVGLSRRLALKVVHEEIG
jgi:hypothetical protein